MAVMRIASAYWNSRVLHVAHSLDVFTALAAAPTTAAEVAKKCGADERGIELIMIACVGLGLLEKRDGKIKNGQVTETFLVKGAQRYHGGIVSKFADWVAPCSQLHDSVLMVRPVVEKQHDHCDEATRTYI